MSPTRIALPLGDCDGVTGIGDGAPLSFLKKVAALTTTTE